MSFQFEISAKEKQEIFKIMDILAIPEDEREEHLAEIQRDGGAYMFEYGSLLHQPMENALKVAERAHVKGWSAEAAQAFSYYGGEEGIHTMMLALEEKPDKTAHGLVRKYPMNSGQDIFNYYNTLATRENPVNNPIYKFNRKIEATTDAGQPVRCYSCLSNTEGPFYIGDKLTDEEKALIIAFAQGDPKRLDNATFRDNVESPLSERIKFADLARHQLTGAAYFFVYKEAYDKWDFPENTYLNTLVDNIQKAREDMPWTKHYLESIEQPETELAKTFDAVNYTVSPGEQKMFDKYREALEKLHAALLENKNYRTWQREWNGTPKQPSYLDLDEYLHD